MTGSASYLRNMLRNLRSIREKAAISAKDLEERLILGPGWVSQYEEGKTIPSLDLLMAILNELGATLSDLLMDPPSLPSKNAFQRHIAAKQLGHDLNIEFIYANYDAIYTLENASVDEFETVIRTLRDGLARLKNIQGDLSERVKTDAVAQTFLKAVNVWPHANPSDLWWFVVYRAYCDPFNHPAQFARLDFSQSWKRTG